MPSLLKMVPIPKGHPRANVWKTKVIFHSVDPDHPDAPPEVAYFEAESIYGVLRWGLGEEPDNRVGWAWKETGGGGPVTLIFSLEPGKSVLDGLWIGLIPELRENMGPGEHLCIVGGFQKPPETPLEAHRREFQGETGGNAEKEKEKELDGLPINSNRMYFEADPNAGEGGHPFTVEVPFQDLVPTSDGTKTHATWQPKGKQLVFQPWRNAARTTADAMVGLPLARLLAHLTAT